MRISAATKNRTGNLPNQNSVHSIRRVRPAPVGVKKFYPKYSMPRKRIRSNHCPKIPESTSKGPPVGNDTQVRMIVTYSDRKQKVFLGPKNA